MNMCPNQMNNCFYINLNILNIFSVDIKIVFLLLILHVLSILAILNVVYLRQEELTCSKYTYGIQITN